MEGTIDDIEAEDDEFVHVEDCPACASQEVHEILSEKEVGGGADYRVRCETCSHVHLIQVRPPKAVSVQFTLSDGAHSISEEIEVDDPVVPPEEAIPTPRETDQSEFQVIAEPTYAPEPPMVQTSMQPNMISGYEDAQLDIPAFLRRQD